MHFELAPFALPAGYADAVLSREDAKRHCSIDADETMFDDEIDAYRGAAVDMVEKYCGVYLTERLGVVWKADTLALPLRLGVWPVSEITALSWIDSNGSTQFGDETILRLGLRDEVHLMPGQSMPSGVAAGVEIEFSAGFESPPPALVQAARMFCAHLWRNRETVITGTISGEIPLGFRQLCGAYRMPVI